MNAGTTVAKRSSATHGGNTPINGTALFGANPLATMDIDAVMASGRKTMAAVAQLRQSALAGAHEAQRRHMELINQTMDGYSTMLTKLMSQSTAIEDWLESQAETSKQTLEKGWATARGLADFVAQLNQEAFAVISKRVSESISEIGAATSGRAANGG